MAVDLKKIYVQEGSKGAAEDIQYKIELSLSQVKNILNECKNIIEKEEKNKPTRGGYKKIFQSTIILRQFFTGEMYVLEVAQEDKDGVNIGSVQRANFTPKNLFSKEGFNASNSIEQIQYCCKNLEKEELRDQQAIKNLNNILKKIASQNNMREVVGQYYLSNRNLDILKNIFKKNNPGKYFTKKQKNEIYYPEAFIKQSFKDNVENNFEVKKNLYQLYSNDKGIGSFTSPTSGTSYFAWTSKNPAFEQKISKEQTIKVYTKDQFKTYNRGHVVEEYLAKYRNNSNFMVNSAYKFAIDVGKSKENLNFFRGGDYSLKKIAVQVKLSNNRKISSFNQLKKIITQLNNVISKISQSTITTEELKKELTYIFEGYSPHASGAMEKHLSTELLDKFISGKTVEVTF